MKYICTYINSAQTQYEKNKQPNRKIDKRYHRHKIQMVNKHENTLKLISKHSNVYEIPEIPFYNHWTGKRMTTARAAEDGGSWLLMNTTQGWEVHQYYHLGKTGYHLIK